MAFEGEKVGIEETGGGDIFEGRLIISAIALDSAATLRTSNSNIHPPPFVAIILTLPMQAPYKGGPQVTQIQNHLECSM